MPGLGAEQRLRCLIYSPLAYIRCVCHLCKSSRSCWDDFPRENSAFHRQGEFASRQHCLLLPCTPAAHPARPSPALPSAPALLGRAWPLVLLLGTHFQALPQHGGAAKPSPGAIKGSTTGKQGTPSTRAPELPSHRTAPPLRWFGENATSQELWKARDFETSWQAPGSVVSQAGGVKQCSSTLWGADWALRDAFIQGMSLGPSCGR